jgi:hypothetical protein
MPSKCLAHCRRRRTKAGDLATRVSKRKRSWPHCATRSWPARSGNLATRAADFDPRPMTLVGAITDDRRTALRAAVEPGWRRPRARRATGCAIFGGELPGSSLHASDPATLTTAGAAHELLGSDRLAPAAGRSVGRTHANVARVTEVFLRREAQAGRWDRSASRRRRSQPATNGSRRRSPAPAGARQRAGSRSCCTHRSGWQRRPHWVAC